MQLASEGVPRLNAGLLWANLDGSEHEQEAPAALQALRALRALIDQDELRPLLGAQTREEAIAHIQRSTPRFIRRLIAFDEVLSLFTPRTALRADERVARRLGKRMGSAFNASCEALAELDSLYVALLASEPPVDEGEARVFAHAYNASLTWTWAANAVLLWTREHGAVVVKAPVKALIEELLLQTPVALVALREVERVRAEEDAEDIAAANAARQDSDFIPWEAYLRGDV